MKRLGLEQEVVDRDVYEHTLARFRERRIVLPTFAELADPATIPATIRGALISVGPDEANPLNLFRVHWHNDASRVSSVDVPDHVVLPRSSPGCPPRSSSPSPTASR